ncbi:Uncharacterised protein [Bordetella pertussis]|nr:Uncharacterised protein [Bordetella pertussis]
MKSKQIPDDSKRGTKQGQRTAARMRHRRNPRRPLPQRQARPGPKLWVLWVTWPRNAAAHTRDTA